MSKTNTMNIKGIFQKGEKISSETIINDHFTGTVWLHTLVPPDTAFNCPVFYVTFEPGARNNWHKHPGGQILLVTDGRGYYQEDGKKAQVIREGDVVKIPMGVKHWHGAAPDNWFAHIAISTNPNAGEPVWLEPVTDEAFSRLS